MGVPRGHGHEIQSSIAGARGQFAPVVDEVMRARQIVRRKQDEHRLAFHRQVAAVLKRLLRPAEMCLFVGAPGVLLFDEDRFRIAVPDTGPRLICPREAKRKVGLAAIAHFFERPFDNAPSVAEPIVPVSESFHTGTAGHLGLRFASFGNAQIVETEIGR